MRALNLTRLDPIEATRLTDAAWKLAGYVCLAAIAVTLGLFGEAWLNVVCLAVSGGRIAYTTAQACLSPYYHAHPYRSWRVFFVVLAATWYLRDHAIVLGPIL